MNKIIAAILIVTAALPASALSKKQQNINQCWKRYEEIEAINDRLTRWYRPVTGRRLNNRKAYLKKRIKRFCKQSRNYYWRKHK